MQELTSVGNLTEIDWVSRVLEVDRSDWAMALEPGSLALYDGALTGISGARDFYLEEDFIYELFARLAGEEAWLRPFFATYAAFDPPVPFGQRISLWRAQKSCALLVAKTHAVSWPPVHAAATRAPAPWPLARCLPCHRDDDVGIDGAPPIPFGQPERLVRLKAASGRSLRDEIQLRAWPNAEPPMPPRGPALLPHDLEALQLLLHDRLHP